MENGIETICPECGATHVGNENFCDNCGAIITNE